MKRNLIWLSLFGIAMAYVETAVVIYLRELYFPGNILKIFPLKFTAFDLSVELAREAATVIMLLSVSFLMEKKNFVRIFAAFVYAFGLWDLFYYIWLKITIHWPVAWLEWDILFLIPWAWFGPWLCPALIALLFVVWGGIVLQSNKTFYVDKISVSLFMIGTFISLFTFLQPSMSLVLQEGLRGIDQFIPTSFLWKLFVPGYLLMAAGLFNILLKNKS